jgi:hypothetical protein
MRRAEQSCEDFAEWQGPAARLSALASSFNITDTSCPSSRTIVQTSFLSCRHQHPVNTDKAQNKSQAIADIQLLEDPIDIHTHGAEGTF